MQKLTIYPSSMGQFAKLGIGITGLVVVRNFSKVTKKDWLLPSVPKNTDFANFQRTIAKNCDVLPSKFKCKN